MSTSDVWPGVGLGSRLCPGQSGPGHQSIKSRRIAEGEYSERIYTTPPPQVSWLFHPSRLRHMLDISCYLVPAAREPDTSASLPGFSTKFSTKTTGKRSLRFLQSDKGSTRFSLKTSSKASGGLPPLRTIYPCLDILLDIYRTDTPSQHHRLPDAANPY